MRSSGIPSPAVLCSSSLTHTRSDRELREEKARAKAEQQAKLAAEEAKKREQAQIRPQGTWLTVCHFTSV